MIDRLIYHLELENPEEVSKWEDGFMEEIKKRGEDFKAYQDQYGEHPDEREAKLNQITEKLADVTTLTTIYQGMKEKVRTSLVWMFLWYLKWFFGFTECQGWSYQDPSQPRQGSQWRMLWPNPCFVEEYICFHSHCFQLPS